MRLRPERARSRLPSSVVIGLGLLAYVCQAEAIELNVEPRQVSVDESVKITIVLDGDLASLDVIDLPLSNLELSGPASSSSQFSIINGSMSRKRTLTWWASPVNPGSASVGPIRIESPRGELVLVPAVGIRVLPPADIGASGPSEALDRLYLAGRDEVVLVAELSPTTAIVGQEVIVTWTLYSAVSLRGFAISSIPKLDSFWVEEDLVENRSPRSSRIGTHEVQKMDVRRASLFPLKEGTLEIPPLEVRVEVIRPFRDPFGGFGLTEERVAEVRRRSAPTSVSVKAAPVVADVIGRFEMWRSVPSVSPEGLVSFEVTVEGTGSLRAMPPPRFVEDIAGEVEVEDADADVVGRTPLQMRRIWRYVVFPRESGALKIPRLEATTFIPGAVSTRTLRTAPVTVDVVLGTTIEASGESSPSRESGSPPLSRVIAIAVLFVAVVATVILVRRTQKSANAELERIVATVSHTITLRKRLDEAATRRGRNPTLLFGESSELGDAWRAALSLLDRIEKEPESIDEPEQELRTRVQRLLDALDDRR